MDPTTTLILAVVGLMAANHLVMRVAGLRGRAPIFWALQVINLTAGAAIIWFGIPGLDAIPIFAWLVGLLFLFRVVQNNMLRARFLRERHESTQDDDKRARIRAALDRGRDV